MTIGDFVWTDLSTFDLKQARKDYEALFGWQFAGDRAYDFATLNDQPAAAIFPMPPFLVKLNLPSFWMSYVRVEDLDASLAKARAYEGVKVEIEPQAFDKQSRIALVRDPAGAGFTLYEGPDIRPSVDLSNKGLVVDTFHHLESIDKISGFYESLFGWQFKLQASTPWPTYAIHHADGSIIAYVEEVPERIRATFAYWMPCFSVASLEETKALVEKRGGNLISDMEDGRLMFADAQGASFMVRT